jgi:hypothetical protein
VTPAVLALLLNEPRTCPANLGHLPCVLHLGHHFGHLYVSASSAPDRRAG